MIGSGAGDGSALRSTATGRRTVRPVGFERSSGTVSTPHVTRLSLGTLAGHGASAYSGS